jgi:hypothetical protein
VDDESGGLVVRKALLSSVAIGSVLLLASCGLFGQDTPPPVAQQQGPVIVNYDNSVFWVVIVLLIMGCFVMMRNWGKQETRAELAALEARLLAAQQQGQSVLERRAVLNGYPVGYPEYRQIGR